MGDAGDSAGMCNYAEMWETEKEKKNKQKNTEHMVRVSK